jgi:hypothetical protein
MHEGASNQGKSLPQMAIVADPFRVGLFFPGTLNLQGNPQLTDAEEASLQHPVKP